MKKLRIGLCLALLVSALTPAKAKAAEATFFSLHLAYPSLKVALDPRLSPSLGSSFGIGVEAFKTFNNLPMAIGVFSQIYMGGPFAGMPFAQMGIPIYYFPFTRLESTYTVDNEVTVHSNAWTPYLKLTPGFAFMNFRNSPIGAEFGSSSLMYILSAGVMMPWNEKMRWGGEVSYTSTLSANDIKQNPISVSGILVSGHITFFLP